MNQIKDVFISYSTKDQVPKNFLREIFDKEGISYFLDEISLELGKDIEASLETNLQQTRFTVLLVSRNSLFSTWVCLESIHRLQEESFTKKVTFLPILVDMSVMSLDFPIEMAKHYKAKLEDLEAKRAEARSLGLSTKLYNDEIERVEKVLPQISDILQKIKNGLSGNFADENRKSNDLQKLINTIKSASSASETTNTNAQSASTQPVGNIPSYDPNVQLFYSHQVNLEEAPSYEDDVVSNEYRETSFKNGQLQFKNISDDQTEIWFGIEYPTHSPFVKFSLGTKFSWDKSLDYAYFSLAFTAWNEGYFHKLTIDTNQNFIVYEDYNEGNEEKRRKISNDWQHLPEEIEIAQKRAYDLSIVVMYPEGSTDNTNQVCTIEYYVNSILIFKEENTKLRLLPYYFGIEISAGVILDIQYMEITVPEEGQWQ